MLALHDIPRAKRVSIEEVATRVRHLHEWDVTPLEAVAVQKRLRDRLRFPARRLAPRRVAAADLSSSPGSDRLFAVVAVFAWPGLAPLEERRAEARAAFPYVPGLLSFREIPLLLPMFAALAHRPQLVVVDGHGTAHPRRFGIACHLGLALGVPAFGCAKSLLVGDHAPLAHARGSRRPIVDRGERVGVALRTRAGVKPVFVSPGHLISMAEAVRWTLALAPRYRLTEPVRHAHAAVNRFRLDRLAEAPARRRREAAAAVAERA
jgi:deoxyribonuclease V